MVPRWKKLAFSLVATFVGSAGFAALTMLFLGKSEDFLESFALGSVLIFAVSLSGWVIAIPIILLVNDVAGWRFWLYLGIGTSVAPLIAYAGMILPFLKSYKGPYDQTSAALAVLGFSALISCIATLTHLVLLRRSQKSLSERSELLTSGHR